MKKKRIMFYTRIYREKYGNYYYMPNLHHPTPLMEGDCKKNIWYWYIKLRDKLKRL